MDALHPLFRDILQSHGITPPPPVTGATVRCPHCVGLGRMSDAPCSRCDGDGHVIACAECELEPVDPLFAPCCSGTCRDAWEQAQPRPMVMKAP